MPKGSWLGEFELCVLLALAALDRDDGYASRVREEMLRRARREVSLGAVYSTLRRLEDKGVVMSRVEAPLPEPGGHSRKCFQLTTEGERSLTSSAAMLKRMLSAWRTASPK